MQVEENASTANLVEILDILTEIKEPTAFPWPYADNSVQAINCIGILEYIPGKLRGKFMDEMYRVLVPKGTVNVGVMYWNSSMAYHDYRFEWPPIAEQSFLMFNKTWREGNRKNVDLVCNFDFTYGFNYEPETAARNVETQVFQVKHYSNAANALQLVLTRD